MTFLKNYLFFLILFMSLLQQYANNTIVSEYIMHIGDLFAKRVFILTSFVEMYVVRKWHVHERDEQLGQ